MFSRSDYLNYKLSETKETKTGKHKIVSAIFKGSRNYSARMIGLPCVVIIPELVVSVRHLYLLDPHINLIKKIIGEDPRDRDTVSIILDWDKLIKNAEQAELRKAVTDILSKQLKNVMMYIPFLSNNDELTQVDFYITPTPTTSLYLLFNKPPLLTDPAGKTTNSANLERELATYFYFGNAKKLLNNTIVDFLEKNRFLTINLRIDNKEAGKNFINTFSRFVSACMKSFGHSCVHKIVCASTTPPFIIDAALINIYSISDIVAVFDHKRAGSGFVLEIILSNAKFQTAVFENSAASIILRFIFAEAVEGIFEVDGEPMVYSNTRISECMSLLEAVISKSTKV
jgi:hypothetical protein